MNNNGYFRQKLESKPKKTPRPANPFVTISFQISFLFAFPD